MEEILRLRPDGLMLSNGPGDPAENTGIIEQLRLLCAEQLPTFGICLGHQLLALSQGCLLYTSSRGRYRFRRCPENMRHRRHLFPRWTNSATAP